MLVCFRAVKPLVKPHLCVPGARLHSGQRESSRKKLFHSRKHLRSSHLYIIYTTEKAKMASALCNRVSLRAPAKVAAARPSRATRLVTKATVDPYLAVCSCESLFLRELLASAHGMQQAFLHG
jgi:hypothetical protein